MTPDEQDWLARRFEDHRTRLRAVAYRMLGSVPEAEEAVQDAWLRVSRAGAEGIENLGGWLTTIVARVCLNALQARKVRAEHAAGLRIPDPIVSREGDAGPDPEREALLADSVGLVNGAAGAVIVDDDRAVAVMAFTVSGGKIVEIDAFTDPERLNRLDLDLDRLRP